MSKDVCKICGNGQFVFPLDFEPYETDAGEAWRTYLCSSCWEIIAAIAGRIARGVVSEVLEKIKENCTDE